FRLQTLGIIPPRTLPAEWHDTAALSVYLQAPRSLEGACRELLGETPDKSVRDAMKGANWLTAKLLLQDQRVLAYALDDARFACRLWLEHANKWPTHERMLSSLTIQQGEYGIHLDQQRIDEGIRTLSLECERT